MQLRSGVRATPAKIMAWTTRDIGAASVVKVDCNWGLWGPGRRFSISTSAPSVGNLRMCPPWLNWLRHGPAQWQETISGSRDCDLLYLCIAYKYAYLYVCTRIFLVVDDNKYYQSSTWGVDDNKNKNNIGSSNGLLRYNYSWIDHGLQSGPITLAFSLWLSESKTKTSFWFLIKKIRGPFFYFVRKVKKWAQAAKNDVVGDSSENLMVLQ